jgi:glutamyl-tRNA reductase
VWALNAPQKERALRAFHERLGGQVVVLATCNRTELYFYSGQAPVLSDLTQVLGDLKGAEAAGDPSVAYRRDDEHAVRHLFAVASGLDSQILGETEIQGQVREDLARARAAGSCGHELGRLFDHALKVGKRVRSETRLSEGVLSAGQAGVLLASKVLGDLGGAEVLLVGTGKIGTLTARALLGHGAGRLRVASRTDRSARRLAGEFDAVTVPFDEVPAAVAASDLVISSTAAPGYLFEAAALAPLVRARSDRALVIVDLAVPRDFDPAVGRLDNVFLYDLDDLEAVLAQSRTQRQEEIPRAELIVAEEARKFLAQLRFRREIEPLVARLVATAEAVRQDELGRRSAGLDAETGGVVDAVTRRVIRRVLLLPVNRLKELRNQGDLSPEAIEFLRRIFEVRSDDDPSRRNAR